MLSPLMGKLNLANCDAHGADGVVDSSSVRGSLRSIEWWWFLGLVSFEYLLL